MHHVLLLTLSLHVGHKPEKKWIEHIKSKFFRHTLPRKAYIHVLHVKWVNNWKDKFVGSEYFWKICLFTCLLSAWLTVIFLVIPRLMGQGPVYVIFKLWDKKFLEVLLRKLNLCFLFKRYTYFKMGMFWLSFRIVISIMSAVYFWERQFFWSGLVFFDSLATQRNTT